MLWSLVWEPITTWFCLLLANFFMFLFINWSFLPRFSLKMYFCLHVMIVLVLCHILLLHTYSLSISWLFAAQPSSIVGSCLFNNSLYRQHGLIAKKWITAFFINFINCHHKETGICRWQILFLATFVWNQITRKVLTTPNNLLRLLWV